MDSLLRLVTFWHFLIFHCFIISLWHILRWFIKVNDFIKEKCNLRSKMCKIYFEKERLNHTFTAIFYFFCMHFFTSMILNTYWIIFFPVRSSFWCRILKIRPIGVDSSFVIMYSITTQWLLQLHANTKITDLWIRGYALTQKWGGGVSYADFYQSSHCPLNPNNNVF